MQQNFQFPTAEDMKGIENYNRYTGNLVSKGMKSKAMSGGLPGCAPVGYLNKREDEFAMVVSLFDVYAQSKKLRPRVKRGICC